jgi:hypothetical protein
MGNYSSRAAKYGRQRSRHPRHPYFRDESRWEVDVTEMTLYQKTVVVAGKGGVLSVDTQTLNLF